MKIPYGRQEIRNEDIEEVVEVLKSDYLTQGPVVSRFENAIAEYVGAKYAVAVCNATAALHIACSALGVGPGSKIITTPISFVASSNCVLYCEGRVEFVDIDKTNYCIDLNLLEEKLSSHDMGTFQGIIPVHFAGHVIDLERLKKIADKYNLWIIDDACHALGGEFTDSLGIKHRVGCAKFTNCSIFSFHPVKHIACGEGGMITTNDKSLYEKLLFLRSHGITRDPSMFTQNHGSWYTEMQFLGYNYRISDILCALGLSQLKRIENNINRRHEIAQKYIAELKNINITLPTLNSHNTKHALHLFVIRTSKRKKLYDFLKEFEILAQVHYLPIYQHPYYRKHGFLNTKLVQAEKYYKECLSIPMYHSLTEDQQLYVIKVIKEFFMS